MVLQYHMAGVPQAGGSPALSRGNTASANADDQVKIA
jgi:hypothetical protein